LIWTGGAGVRGTCSPNPMQSVNSVSLVSVPAGAAAVAPSGSPWSAGTIAASQPASEWTTAKGNRPIGTLAWQRSPAQPRSNASGTR
jgi:hypothetical protein